jgi:predicted metalloprotease with PDZ domain
MPDPHSHLFQVELTIPASSEPVVVGMPVWTPGSYLVREFARHIEGLWARSAGAPVPVTPLDKHRFRIEAPSGAPLTVGYAVYANDLTVRTSHLDGTHGYFNGANLFLYVEGRERQPHRLAIAPPPGWKVATSLEGAGTEFAARDYDELVDAPVEIGTHATSTFEVEGKPHAIALYGRGNADLEKFTRDTKRIVESAAGLMGSLPYRRYLFIVHLTEKRRGGLEHAESSTLNVHRMAFGSRDAYEETLALAAHEHFHLWNVKRLRPAALTPYDYAREQYTGLLWWFEGATSYYERLLLTRAGLLEPKRYLKHLGEAFTQLERLPGARKMSLEEASRTAWIKFYRADENSGNSSVSYYLKGELVAFALDCLLRSRGQSLDALLQALYRRHQGGGVPEDGVERAATELAGAEVGQFFEKYVRGTAPLEPLAEVLGLRLRRRPSFGLDDKGGSPPRADAAGRSPGWLGLDLAPGPRPMVASVREGGPAHRAGVYAGDELVAESGFRLDRGALWERLQERGPTGKLVLTVFRRDELVEVSVPLAAVPEDAVWIEPQPSANAIQKAAFESWSGTKWPF